MKTKISIQQLAMYIGCECKFLHYWGPRWDYGKLIGVKEEPQGIFCSILVSSAVPDCAWLYFDQLPNECQRIYNAYLTGEQLVFPILRKTSDIQPDEREIIRQHQREGANLPGVQSMGKTMTYLIEKQFDIFGWIDNGIAIDKAIFKNEKENSSRAND
jgi:hypothetical protein